MTLWFENRYGDSRKVATCANTEEVFKAIKRQESI